LITQSDPAHFPVVSLCLQHELDGVIFYHDRTMRIFNDDGSEAEMCGNGLRCLIAYLWDNGEREETYTIHTKGGTYHGSYDKGEVTITFPKPSSTFKKKIGDSLFDVVDTGVPHAIMQGEMSALGPLVVEAGYNLTTYQLMGDYLKVATFERGLNRISPACGTGCMAVAYLLGKERVTLEVPSGERLIATTDPLTLTGKVEKKETLSILDSL